MSYTIKINWVLLLTVAFCSPHYSAEEVTEKEKEKMVNEQLEQAPYDGSADRAQKNDAKPDRSMTYKVIDGAELKLYIFEPQADKKEGVKVEPRPAIVFFHGGGWKKGDPSQFYWQSRYLAGRGMVAISAQYRLKQGRNKNKKDAGGACAEGVADCIADAQAAMRFVRKHAAKLGVDPRRIAAGGGSAGGHLAAECAVLPNAQGVTARPDLLVLFNPALFHRLAENTIALKDFTATTPPSVQFYGSRDEMVEYGRYTLVQAGTLGNKVDVHIAKDQGHGFFNNTPWRESTMAIADAFLVKHGYLQGPPALDVDQHEQLQKMK